MFPQTTDSTAAQNTLCLPTARYASLGVMIGPVGWVDYGGECDDHEGGYCDVMMSEYGEKKRRAQQEAVLWLVPERVGVEREGEEYEAE